MAENHESKPKWKRETLFTYRPNDQERAELKRMCAERDKNLKDAGIPMKTIITEKEMADRKRLGMNCDEYITTTEFKKKIALENPNFILRRKTLQQELGDAKVLQDL